MRKVDNKIRLVEKYNSSRVATKIFDDSSWTMPPQQNILIEQSKIYSPPPQGKILLLKPNARSNALTYIRHLVSIGLDNAP